MLKSQEMRKLAPEMDPLRIGTGWKKEDLEKPQIMVESTYGDSHPGSGHLNLLVEEVRKGVAEAGGFGARCCSSQGTILASGWAASARWSGGLGLCLASFWCWYTTAKWQGKPILTIQSQLSQGKYEKSHEKRG